MNKLIITIAALTLLASSLTGQAQTETVIKPAKISLESEYQKELDKWMLQAYEGDRDAQFKVGVLFTNDQFQSADLEQSAYWYKQSARQGNALAQYNLGHQYLTGSGVQRNESEAMKWWLKAAEQDHALAQFNVGRAYYLGIGLAEDHAQSRLWFKRAAKNNEPKSIDILQQLGWADAGEYKSASERGAAQPQIASQAVTPQPVLVTSPEATTQAITDELAAEGLVVDGSLEDVDDSLSVDDSPSADDSLVEADSSQAQSTSVQKTPQAELSKPIAVYTNPAKRSVLIAILDVREQLSVVSTNSEWTEVTNSDGFPVWIHENYITVSDDIGLIKGDAVNARSVPLITSGTIVGQLNNDEAVVVLDKKDGWYRVMSPSRFKAWVKTDEFNSKEVLEPQAADPIDNQATEQAIEQVTATTSAPVEVSDNDNGWLFSQPVDGYTLQLASFDDLEKVAEFKNRKKFLDNPDLHSFTSESKNIVWTYFLYGEFGSDEAAKLTRTEIKQKRAWVRSFGTLQQNRCLAWKKQIPTPKELNKYCS